MTNHKLLQARIIHLSDLHFGDGHRFKPDGAPTGSPGAARGYQTLAESIVKDLAGADFEGAIWHGDKTHKNPLLLAVSGDLTQKGTHAELVEAEKCLRKLCEASPLSSEVSMGDVAMVPGNHDLVYDKQDAVERWGTYCAFDSRVRGLPYVDPSEAQNLSRVCHRERDALIVAEINSAFHVVKDRDDSYRGEVDEGVLTKLHQELERIPKATRQQCLKVAVVHHHPIVLPFFAESKRGYDAILGATKLLRLLRDNEFQLILHGHKHFPHTFSYDPQCAWTQDPAQGIFVVAGGSAGAGPSNLVASEQNATNTYNLIALRWNPEARHGRIRVVTRGLCVADDGGRELLASQWHWRTLKVDDRLLGAQRPRDSATTRLRTFDQLKEKSLDDERRAHYRRLRGNMLVVDVVPSLDPSQGYDATAYLVTHHSLSSPEPPEPPVRVEWCAGEKFKFKRDDGGVVPVVKISEEPPFAARFSYWGSAMLQARLFFADGKMESHVIYAHMFGF